MINHTYDFDDQYFRMVTIALARTLNKSIRWINYFEPKNETDTGRLRVLIPFYTSLTGDERFNMDAFVDDIADKRVNMNTDQYQRGVITFNNFTSKSEEFANPNQYLAQKADVNGTTRKVISKVKAVPVSINYDIEIHLATQNEVDKCSQRIMSLLYNYMFFNIDYYGIKIDAVLKLPDDKTIEIQREINYDSDKKKTIKFSLEVQSYFPIFRIDLDDLITCDNDGDINWDYIGVPKPSLDYEKTLKAYNYRFGQYSYVYSTGKTEGEDVTTEVVSKEGLGEMKKVYWNAYYHELNRQESVLKERRLNENPKNWTKEDLEISPIQPGKSKNDANINLLTTDEITEITRQYIEDNNFSGLKDMSEVINYISRNYSEVYNGDITKIVKSLL